MKACITERKMVMLGNIKSLEAYGSSLKNTHAYVSVRNLYIWRFYLENHIYSAYVLLYWVPGMQKRSAVWLRLGQKV